MTEAEMWVALAAQLEPLVSEYPEEDVLDEHLIDVHKDVQDREFAVLLAGALKLEGRETVRNIRRHPHYPGINLTCDRYWCDTGARNRPCPLQQDGRCPLFHRPATTDDDPGYGNERAIQ